MVAEAMVARKGSAQIVLVDDAVPKGKRSTLLGFTVFSPVDVLCHPMAHSWIVAVGDNRARQRIANSLASNKVSFVQAIDPTSVISPSAVIAEGVMVLANATINSEANVGEHAIVNTGSIIEHDCQIGPYCHIAPGSKLGGGVRVGEGTLVGIGSTVLPRVTIGAWCTIGAGTVVLNDVPDGSVVVGVPGRVIKEVKECAQ